MLDIAGGSSSPALKMTPERSRQEQQEQLQRQSDDRHEVSVLGTPPRSPRSPARNEHYPKLSCGKEEGAAWLSFCVCFFSLSVSVLCSLCLSLPKVFHLSRLWVEFRI